MPVALCRVDRRLLLHQPLVVKHATVGRRFPRMQDAAFLH